MNVEMHFVLLCIYLLNFGRCQKLETVIDAENTKKVISKEMKALKNAAESARVELYNLISNYENNDDETNRHKRLSIDFMLNNLRENAVKEKELLEAFQDYKRSGGKARNCDISELKNIMNENHPPPKTPITNNFHQPFQYLRSEHSIGTLLDDKFSKSPIKLRTNIKRLTVSSETDETMPIQNFLKKYQDFPKLSKSKNSFTEKGLSAPIFDFNHIERNISLFSKNEQQGENRRIDNCESNNLAHEANYKLSKVEQEEEAKRKTFNPSFFYKRATKKRPMKKNNLKTSKHLMNKGFGPTLPSSAYSVSKKEQMLDSMIKRLENELFVQGSKSKRQNDESFLNLKKPVADRSSTSYDALFSPNLIDEKERHHKELEYQYYKNTPRITNEINEPSILNECYNVISFPLAVESSKSKEFPESLGKIHSEGDNLSEYNTPNLTPAMLIKSSFPSKKEPSYLQIQSSPAKEPGGYKNCHKISESSQYFHSKQLDLPKIHSMDHPNLYAPQKSDSSEEIVKHNYFQQGSFLTNSRAAEKSQRQERRKRSLQSMNKTHNDINLTQIRSTFQTEKENDLIRVKNERISPSSFNRQINNKVLRMSIPFVNYEKEKYLRKEKESFPSTYSMIPDTKSKPKALKSAHYSKSSSSFSLENQPQQFTNKYLESDNPQNETLGEILQSSINHLPELPIDPINYKEEAKHEQFSLSCNASKRPHRKRTSKINNFKKRTTINGSYITNKNKRRATPGRSFDDMISGKFSSEIINTVFDKVQVDPELRNLWPSLEKNKPLSEKQMKYFCSIRNQQNDNEMQRNMQMLNKAIEDINDLIEEQTHSRTSITIRPDISQIDEFVIKAYSEMDKSSQLDQNKRLACLLSSDIHSLNTTNLIDDFSKKVNLLTPSEFQQQRQKREGYDTKHFLNKELEVLEKPNQLSPEFLKLLKTSELIRDAALNGL